MHTRHWFRVVLGLASPFVLLAGSGHADTYPRANELDVLEYTFRVTLTDESDVGEGLASVDRRSPQDGARALAPAPAVVRPTRPDSARHTVLAAPIGSASGERTSISGSAWVFSGTVRFRPPKPNADAPASAAASPSGWTSNAR